MYWQKRFALPSPDADIEAKIVAIRKSDKDFGYRRIWGKLHDFHKQLFNRQTANQYYGIALNCDISDIMEMVDIPEKDEVQTMG